MNGYKISGMHICITGKLSMGCRRYIQEVIESKGGIVNKRVTKKTDYLVLGDLSFRGGTSKKLRTAMRYGTEIINEAILRELMEQRLVLR